MQDVNLISVAQLKAYGEWRLIFFFSLFFIKAKTTGGRGHKKDNNNVWFCFRTIKDKVSRRKFDAFMTLVANSPD